MVLKFKLLSLGLCVCLMNFCANLSCLAETAKTYERSKDTHAIEDMPTEVVEKEAQRQIEESADLPDKSKTAAGTGKVISSQAEKKETAVESTFVGKDDPSVDASVRQSSSLKRPTVALALGGGGARGAAHIGVLRVLKENKIQIDYIVGNSMGSIVGGLYAAGVPLEDIEKMVLDNSLKRAYIPGLILPTLILNPLEKVFHPFRKHYAGIFSGKKFGKFLEEKLPEGVENVEDTPIPFSAVATNLIDGKAYRISDGRLSTAIRASSTIPSVLQPVAIGDKVYVDGGVRANMPASAARDTGADVVIAVLVDEPLKDLPAKRFRKLSAIVSRLGDVMLGVSDARQMPFADIIINPDVSGIPVVKGKPEDAERAIKAGEDATRKALPVIKKRLSLKSS
ncbi:patatin-like phospholipase family protein [bacterium]|nr:patatin-like phospholipase family protein [bacterium]